ncbi:MAG: dihydroxyacetone kinase subunit DhaK [Oscillospiraceae bacterium]
MNGRVDMQKLFNQPEDMVDEAIVGFVKCYHQHVAHTRCSRTLKYKHAPVSGKVGIVTGGGSGHDPAFMGYLGKNMLDAVAIGDIFTPPSEESFYHAFMEADAGKGVVCLFGNFYGDVVNARKAAERAKAEGVEVRLVIANDDVATDDPDTRRGSTGETLLWKIGGAAAALGYDLNQVETVAVRALSRMRSIGIGLASCIIPEVGRPNYLIERGTMEIGVGHHGQSSMDTCKLKTANETADIMIAEVLKDMSLGSGDQVMVVISGLGNTMLSELHILYSRVCDVLQSMHLDIYKALVGNYFTSLDMMGATLTIFHLDEELKRLLDYPGYAVSLTNYITPQ